MLLRTLVVLALFFITVAPATAVQRMVIVENFTNVG